MTGMGSASPNEDQIITDVTDRVQVAFPARSAAEIRALVTRLFHCYDDSRVRDFIPVLVQREALETLRAGRGVDVA